MLYIFLVTLIYTILVSVSSSFLISLPVPVFLGVLYVLPIIVNLLFIKLQKNDRSKLTYSMLLPTLATVSYLIFAYITSISGAWTEFVNINTLTDGSMSIDIAENLFSSSQVLFVVFVQYASSAAYYLLTKVAQKKDMKGIKYA